MVAEGTLKNLLSESFEQVLQDVGSKPDARYLFRFKDQPTEGTAIHVAALHRQGAHVLQHLLALRADPGAECSQFAQNRYEKTTKIFFPLHLASSLGSTASVQALLEARADVERKSKYNGEDHYPALHSAAYFGRSEVTRLLLCWKATADACNLNGQTPLHICAKMDSWDVARVLVAFSASVSVRDRRHHRPLDYALDSPLAATHMHILTGRSVEEVKIVALRSSDIAANLMKDHRARTRSIIHPSWENALACPCTEEERPCVEDVIELLQTSPGAAADLLDALTVRPPVSSKFEYAMRRRTTTLPYEMMRCAYRPETSWSLGPDGNEPSWHNQLVPEVGGGLQGVRVSVRLLKITSSTPGQPGVIFNSEFFYWLVAAKYPGIFRRQSAQAIVDYTWNNFVRLHYSTRIVIRLLELAMLIYVVASPPTDEFLKRLTWSWAAATSMREISHEVTRAIGSRRLTGSWFVHMGNFWFFFNAGCIVSYAILVYSGIGGMELVQANPAHPELLCLVCSYRWAQLLVMLSAYRYRWIGYQLFPIIQAFFQISGILVIAIVTFCAFAHGFIALEAGKGEEGSISAREIAVGTLRLFLIGDGAGVDLMSNLGTDIDEDVVQPFVGFLMLLGIFCFCICILNIFIAVHGDAYVCAKERVLEDFYLARTNQNLDSLLQATTSLCPRCLQLAWCRFCCRGNSSGDLPLGGPLPCYLAMVLPALCVWIAWLWLDVLHPLIPSVMLMLVLRKGDHQVLSELARGTTLAPSPRSLTADSPSNAKLTRTYPEEMVEEEKVPLHRYLWWATWSCDDEELPGGLKEVADEVHCTKRNVERLVGLFPPSMIGSPGLSRVPSSAREFAGSYLGLAGLGNSLDRGDSSYGEEDLLGGALGGRSISGQGLAAAGPVAAMPSFLARRLERVESKLSELQRDMREVLQRLPPPDLRRTTASWT